jgi:hypothetical protein
MKFRRTLAVGAIGAAALGTSLVNVGPASATQYSGCPWNTTCLFYSPNEAGSASAWSGDKTDYGSQNFLSSGAGQGQNVANNAASGWDTRADNKIRVYTGTSYTGSYQTMNVLYSSGDAINFNTTLRNNNSSHRAI